MDFEYLLFLQNLRAEAPNFINSMLLFISEFAAGSLPVVIIVVFYWCIDKRTGQRMGLCFAGATMVTQLIKNIACVYRPWKQDARLQIAPEAAATATGYSFPSGHATLAASFYGNIAAYLKKYSKWWILPCVLLTLLTAFARNWLGAHTPQDVLVGMMIALVVLLLSKHLLNWADGSKNRDWLLATIGIILSAAMLIYTSVKPYPMDVLPDGTLLVDPWDMVTDCYKAAGAMMGFCLGWVLERHFVGFDAKGAGKARMIRGVVGVALLLAVRKGVWNVWDRILLMWGLEVQIYKNRNMTEKADELIRQMDNLWRFPPTLPPADSELEAERRNRFTVEFCSYKENIEGEDSVTSANEWRLIGLMNLVGYGATGLFPNLVKEKETVDCLIEEYMLNLKKVK